MTVLKWFGIVILSLILVLAITIAVFDWNWVKGYVASAASDMIGRKLSIEGDLDVDLGWITEARAEKIRLANAEWSNQAQMVELETLIAQIDLWELFKSRVVLPLVRLDRPHVLLEVSPQGEGNWVFTNGPEEAESAPQGDSNVPVVQRLLVNDGTLLYKDPNTDTEVDARIATVEGDRSKGESIKASATGRLRGQPLELSLNGQAELQIAGAWRINQLQGRLGNSDLTGAAAYSTDGRIEAKLVSKTLDVDQLSTLFATAEEQPDVEPIELAPLRALNVALDYQADKLVTAALPLANPALHLELAEGRLQLNPLSVDIPGNTLRADLGFDLNEGKLNGKAHAVLGRIDAADGAAGAKDKKTVREFLEAELPLALARPSEPLIPSTLLERLRIDGGVVRYQDPQGAASIDASVNTVAEQDKSRLQVEGKGQIQNQALVFSMLGEPLASIVDDDQSYKLELQGKVNDSELNGQLAANWAGERPLITAELASPRVNLQAFLDAEEQEAEPSKTSESTASAEPPADEPPDLAMMRLMDLALELKFDQVDLPSIALSNVVLDLDLNDGRLTVDPLQAETPGGGVSAKAELAPEDKVLQGAATVRAENLDLRKLLAPFGVDNESLGVVDGAINLTIGGPDAAGDDLGLPYLGRIGLADSEINYRDSDQQIDVSTSIASGGRGIQANGQGSYKGEAFKLSFEGDSLLNLRDPDAAYGLDVTVEVVQTKIQLKGDLHQPFSLDNLDLNLAVAGPDPALLYPVLGLALPNLPPYKVAGDLSLQGDIIGFSNFDGRVGDSDLAGDISVDKSGERPFMKADLVSDKLDFDDLGSLIGATPSTDTGETASEQQKQQAAAQEQRARVLPNAPVDLERLQAMDAQVSFKAKQVLAPKLPLDDVNTNIEIRSGRVTFKPLDFGVAGGNVRSQIELDGRQKPVKGMVDTEIEGVDLRQALKPFEIADESIGVIGGQAKFWVTGNSLADFFASADGGTYLLMTGGKLDSLLVELAGLDAGEALVTLFGENTGVDILCAYADLHSEKGVLNLETFILDTTDTRFAVTGTIDLGKEQLDIVIEPSPKDPSLLTARSPLRIEGTFKNPSAYPEPGELAARGVFAALLAAASPIAALIPLIEPGGGKDSVYCKGLVEDVKKAE